MAPRPSAEERLERILYVLPVASREGGADLAELAAALDVPVERVLRDLEEVTARAYYAPAGAVEDIQIEVVPGDGDAGPRVSVWTTGEFRRPVRLSPLEGLALSLGLRHLAEGAGAERATALRDLAARLDRALPSSAAEPFLAGWALDGGDPLGDGALALLRDAVRERRRCRLDYLKPGQDAPEARVLQPYTLVMAGGRWYALGYCEDAGGVRAFRLDRVLDAAPLDGTFDAPDDFDPGDYVTGDEVFRADDEVEVVVRYSPKIARWILERGAGHERTDGSAVACHAVADPRWLVRHVLQYGGQAEVLEPPEMRELVAAAAARCVDTNWEEET